MCIVISGSLSATASAPVPIPNATSTDAFSIGGIWHVVRISAVAHICIIYGWLFCRGVNWRDEYIYAYDGGACEHRCDSDDTAPFPMEHHI